MAQRSNGLFSDVANIGFVIALLPVIFILTVFESAGRLGVRAGKSMLAAVSRPATRVSRL